MKCKICGKNAESEYCFQHKKRKPLQAVKNFIKKRNTSDKQTENLHNFFLDLWKKRKHYSEISGEYLGSEARSIYFHHILPKEKFPEAAQDEDNIILLTFDEHNNVEMNMYRYEEVNKRRDKLKKKYERAQQRTEER